MKISEVLPKESLPKESISEVYFQYPSKMGGYPNLSSDIPKLYAIGCFKNFLNKNI